MTTDTDITNRALSQIGHGQLTGDLWTENSNEAKQARLHYVTTLTSLLRSAHWNFARKTAYFNLLKAAPGTPENPGPGTVNWDPATQPAIPWLYEYAYPQDCQLVRFISPQIPTGAIGGLPIFSAPSFVPLPEVSMQPQRFVVATDKDGAGNNINVVLCNQCQAIGVYTTLIREVDLWDSLFQDAMVSALAVRLIIALSGDKALLKSMKQDAMQSITQARLTDGNEGLTFENTIPDWIRVRGYNGDWSTPGGGYFGGWVTPSFLLI